jgi:hypothetical protein
MRKVRLFVLVPVIALLLNAIPVSFVFGVTYGDLNFLL